MPISRGIRARKFKTAAASNQTSRRSTTIIQSDEEGNTSEYSHPPSSVHSTLESNPDIAKMYKKQIQNQELYSKSSVDTVDHVGARSQSATAAAAANNSEDDDSSSDESDLNGSTKRNASNSTIVEIPAN